MSCLSSSSSSLSSCLEMECSHFLPFFLPVKFSLQGSGDPDIKVPSQTSVNAPSSPPSAGNNPVRVETTEKPCSVVSHYMAVVLSCFNLVTSCTRRLRQVQVVFLKKLGSISCCRMQAKLQLISTFHKYSE